ncbi:MAG: 50S ribosomal protein L9 [Puniceicoccales bacterium]|jgi:large subunit ribosomal protein L9|nr:50S ribosomal protein L9 [Puniceicoccales bacterium]
MATANILLLKKVENLGAEGDRVSVRAGYARNYLLPNRIAIPVTRANGKQIEALQKKRLEREADELARAKSTAEAIAGLALSFSAKIGENGKMFGSITAANLIAKLAEFGVNLNKKILHMEPAKHVGRHIAKVRLHRDIVIDLAFDVVSEDAAQQPVAVANKDTDNKG